MDDSVLHETWRKRLEGFEQSGMSARDWCAQAGVTLDRFYFWRRRLRAASEQPAPQSNGWATLKLANSNAAICVRVGSATIDVQPGFDPAHLRAIVRTLEPGAC
jgi:hypothetical protein